MIRRIKLQEFRSHANTVLPFETAINVVAGTNGSGKTSLLLGLQTALLGYCETTDRKGSGKEALVRLGKKDYRIELDLDDPPVTDIAEPGNYSLSVGMRSAHGLGADKVSMVREAVENHFSTSRAAIEVVTGGSFFELDAKAQRGLLMGIAGVDLSPERIREYLQAHIGAGYAMVGRSLTTIPTGVEGMDFTEKLLVELRRSVNREADNAQNALDALQRAGGPLQQDPKEVEDRGARLRREIADLQEKYACAKAQNTGAIERLGAATCDLADVDAKIESLKPPADLDRAFKAAKTSISKCREAISVGASERDRVAAALAVKSSELKKLDVFKGADEMPCPTCGQMVDGEKMAKQAEVIEDEIEQLNAERGKYLTAIAQAEDKLGLAAKRLAELEMYSEELAPKRDRLKKELAKLQMGKSTDGGGLDENALSEKLQSKQDELDQWTADFGEAMGRDRDIKNALERIKKLQPAVQVNESAVKAIRAFRIDAVAEKVAGFVQMLNKGGKMFGMTFSVDPQTMDVALGNGLEYRSLSESEKIRVDTIFRALIATMTGLRFIVLDRADVLDRANRVALLQLLIKARIKALVLSKYDSRDDYQPNPHPRIAYWWLSREGTEPSKLERVA